MMYRSAEIRVRYIARALCSAVRNVTFSAEILTGALAGSTVMVIAHRDISENDVIELCETDVPEPPRTTARRAPPGHNDVSAAIREEMSRTGLHVLSTDDGWIYQESATYCGSWENLPRYAYLAVKGHGWRGR